ncbi:unnamed protein product [Rhizoctonia solani]|uniref:Uncharacterized protein n=1 Tax=Rhizoctonia solani TaxID=456999 RepID=A0A8H2X968_9AGAM|nr:unnamed protein product [Rhizoctonia solani]
MPSWAWLGSSASSGNPSLAWSMGNGGKGRMLIKFPLPLDDGWYREQPCTIFRVFQHRKERSGFKHEFIVLQLLDGSVCRIERMGDPDARFDALSPRGSVAHDMAQCFRPDELDQASLDTSDVVAEVELPCDFDLMDVLKICRAIHEGEKTRNYTLQVFNCYFFSLAIQVCLTRLVAHWEDQQLFERWLSQINAGISALPDTFQPFADSSLRQGSILFRVYHALFPHDFDSTQNTSLVEEIKHRLQLWIHEHPGSILQEIVYRINTLLWHSTIDLGLDQFVEEKAREAVLIVVRERMSLILDGDSEDDTPGLAMEKLKGELILLLTQLLAIAGASANKIPKLDKISLKSKNIKKAKVHYSKPPLQTTTELGELSLKRKPVARATRDLATDWYQWITYYLSHMGLWLVHVVLNIWGVTLFTARKNLITCTMIDEKLERVAYEMECLTNYGSADLERLVEELRALSESQVAIWEKNPWADICGCLAIKVSMNILKENETHKPVIWFCPKGKRKFMVLQSISVFQVHIQNRIEMQAREVEGVWLGSAENIQAELVDTLSQVWKLIREDTTLLKKERRRAGSPRHRGSKSKIHAWVREMQRKRKLQAGEENEDSESESSSDGSIGRVSELSRDVDTRSTEQQKGAHEEYARRRQDADEAATYAYLRAVEQARKLQNGEETDEDEESLQRYLKAKYGSPNEGHSEEEEGTGESESESSSEESIMSDPRGPRDLFYRPDDAQSRASVPTIILESPSSDSNTSTDFSDERLLNPEYGPTHPINNDEVGERDIPSMHEPSFDPLAIRTPPHYGRPLSIISEASPEYFPDVPFLDARHSTQGIYPQTPYREEQSDNAAISVESEADVNQARRSIRRPTYLRKPTPVLAPVVQQHVQDDPPIIPSSVLPVSPESELVPSLLKKTKTDHQRENDMEQARDQAWEREQMECIREVQEHERWHREAQERRARKAYETERQQDQEGKEREREEMRRKRERRNGERERVEQGNNRDGSRTERRQTDDSRPVATVDGPSRIVEGPSGIGGSSSIEDSPTRIVEGPTRIGAGPIYIREESARIGEGPKDVAKPSRSTVPLPMTPDEHDVPPEKAGAEPRERAYHNSVPANSAAPHTRQSHPDPEPRYDPNHHRSRQDADEMAISGYVKALERANELRDEEAEDSTRLGQAKIKHGDLSTDSEEETGLSKESESGKPTESGVSIPPHLERSSF